MCPYPHRRGNRCRPILRYALQNRSTFVLSPKMVQRTRLQSKTDDLAFPVRVKLAVPSGGLGGTLTAMGTWLQEHAGKGNYAVHSAPGLAGHTMAVHFRDAETARTFIDAFPSVQLADGTVSGAYYSPSARR